MVHEVIDFFIEEGDNNTSADIRCEINGTNDPDSEQVDPVWKTLKTLLRRVELRSQNHQPQKSPHDARYRASNPSVTVSRQPSPPQAALSPNPSLGTQSPKLFSQAFPSVSGLVRTDNDVGPMADTSDLDIWSFSLLQTPESLKSRSQTHRVDRNRISSSRPSQASGHESDGSRSASGQPGTISPFQVLSDSRKEYRGTERPLGASRDGEAQTYGQGRNQWDSLENNPRSTASHYPGQSSSGTSVNSNLGAMKEHLNGDLDMLVSEELWMDS